MFLEAWQQGIPVITTFDPDGIVSSNRLGWEIESPQDAIRLLREYGSKSKESELRAAASRVSGYFSENHSASRNMPVYLDLFERLIRQC